MARSARVFRLSFRFLWLCLKLTASPLRSLYVIAQMQLVFDDYIKIAIWQSENANFDKGRYKFSEVGFTDGGNK